MTQCTSEDFVQYLRLFDQRRLTSDHPTDEMKTNLQCCNAMQVLLNAMHCNAAQSLSVATLCWHGIDFLG